MLTTFVQSNDRECPLGPGIQFSIHLLDIRCTTSLSQVRSHSIVCCWMLYCHSLTRATHGDHRNRMEEQFIVFLLVRSTFAPRRSAVQGRYQQDVFQCRDWGRSHVSLWAVGWLELSGIQAGYQLSVTAVFSRRLPRGTWLWHRTQPLLFGKHQRGTFNVVHAHSRLQAIALTRQPVNLRRYLPKSCMSAGAGHEWRVVLRSQRVDLVFLAEYHGRKCWKRSRSASTFYHRSYRRREGRDVQWISLY